MIWEKQEQRAFERFAYENQVKVLNSDGRILGYAKGTDMSVSGIGLVFKKCMEPQQRLQLWAFDANAEKCLKFDAQVRWHKKQDGLWKIGLNRLEQTTDENLADFIKKRGEKKINIYDVAREAGVSLATVSRVINGSTDVKEATRMRIEEVIERMHFSPDKNAQDLARRRNEEAV